MLKLSEKLKPYRGLIRSFTSLSILQIANYLFPLIVLPYVVRVLGPAKYGLINFAAAFVAYFNLLCDYGFNLSGTKAISLVRDDKEKLSHTFSVIIFIKLFFLIISFLILVIIVFGIPFFHKNWQLYLLSFGSIVGWVLFPGWFYQGIEQMKYITILHVLVRSISTVLIFVLINVESDFLLLVLLYSSTQILIGILGQLVAIYKFNIKYLIPSIKDLKFRLKEGSNVFFAMISNNIYTTSNTFILGLFANETIVGYFAAADKVRLAFQGIQFVLSQSVFPYVNNLLKDSYNKFVLFIKKLLIFQPAIALLISLFLFVFSFQLTDLLLGPRFESSAVLLRIISVIPLLVSFSNIFGIQIMLSLGYDKAYNLILLSAAIVYIMFMLVLVPKYLAVGTSISFLITELIVTLSTALFLHKQKIFRN